MISIAVEAWRFSRLFERILQNLDAGQQNRYRSQYNWFLKRLEEALQTADLRLVNVEGLEFDPGMAVTPLGGEDEEGEGVLIIERMLEPIIMGKEGLVRMGTVTLKRVGPE